MKRRTFLESTAAGTLAATTLAGCLGTVTGGGASDTLRVATQPAFVDAPSTSAGGWIKREFESRYDATVEWKVPDGELSYYIQRRDEGVPMDADMYVGLTPGNLVTIDRALGDAALLEPFDAAKLDNVGAVKDASRFDPRDRVIPTGGSYISLVYDETVIEPPETFDDLLAPEYRGRLLVANPQTTETGMYFLLWTIHEYGPDGYLDYWRKLAENDVRILGSWSDSYAAYQNEEAPMVVSYSTDQIYADRQDQDMSRHQVAFLDDQGYAYVSGAAKFATTEKHDLSRTFMDFLLEPETQTQIAIKSVGIPAVEDAPLPADFDDLVHVPERPVRYAYDEISGNLRDWRNDWAEQVADR